MILPSAFTRKTVRPARPPGRMGRASLARRTVALRPVPNRSPVAYAVAESLPQTADMEASADEQFLAPSRKIRVLVAGGGIAGLVLAVSLLKKGVDVRIFERDMTAIRGEGKYRGPIQVRCVKRGRAPARISKLCQPRARHRTSLPTK